MIAKRNNLFHRLTAVVTVVVLVLNVANNTSYHNIGSAIFVSAFHSKISSAPRIRYIHGLGSTPPKSHHQIERSGGRWSRSASIKEGPSHHMFLEQVFDNPPASLLRLFSSNPIGDTTTSIQQSTVAKILEPEEITQPDELQLSPAQLLFNAVLLIGSFGFALSTILAVDSGMTRGWTQTEIMMRIPIDNWRTYEYNLEASPIETKTYINVIIYMLGDWLSQTVFEKKNILQFNVSRTLKNGAIGMFFGPIVHQYYEFSDSILPPEVVVNRLYKIFMDQTLYLGVKCSVYIVAVGMLNGDSFEDAVHNVKERIKGVMLTAWKFWPLVHCVTYGVIPARHRILWVNCVDLVWNAILASMTRGRDETVDEDNLIGKKAAKLDDSSSEDTIIVGGNELLQEVPSKKAFFDDAIGKELMIDTGNQILQKARNQTSEADENNQTDKRAEDLIITWELLQEILRETADTNEAIRKEVVIYAENEVI
mmetsp:Transcript_1828/g.2768  ORF Transcript_1828/g.2768 Transcript_1828/m.2768 type:complete len:480 (+) Transcript_1828:152-1591(+)|eukprot:CAMPEP_0195510236 /NCGR_PEP_ID=MMETSP0794_2-20130614/2936_1 /TAXON_ID=515487 /ORGANISM="Stephanopyxis turris, Strain CCMP 815" /LENGTH=479 /DNA_ID=CAMNT_0040637615 /DNA_START=146 /DNA_END=1585 /DNA_ORIENTATION=-